MRLLDKITQVNSALFGRLLWTFLVCGSLWWHYAAHQQARIELARTAARANYVSTLMMRDWVTSHGGVYVPETEATPSNPYLATSPERDLETPSGRKLTLVNPAYMTRQLFEMNEDKFEVRGHITSLDPIRVQNGPDDWEREALKAFERGEQEVFSVVAFHGEDHLRLMRPLITEKRCLDCHAYQGYEEGDIRGGLSISIPVAQFVKSGQTQLLGILLGHFMVWFIGLLAIGLALRRSNVTSSMATMSRLRGETDSSKKSLLASFLIIFLPLSGLAIMITALTFYFEYSNRLEAINREEAHHVAIMDDIVRSRLRHIITDLRVLAEEREYLELLMKNGIGPQKEVERLLLIFSTHKGIYDQTRIIDLNGQEVARVDYNRGTPRIVPRVKLQNKKDRYYFADTMSLEQGETFISPMDLNIEQGKVEFPLKPVIRFGTPIFDAAGNKRGMVILNFLAERLLHDLLSLYDRPEGIAMLLNKEGYWLKAGQADHEWGFMFKERQQRSFGTRFPKEWQRVSTTENGQFRNENGAFTYQTVHVLSGEFISSKGASEAFQASGGTYSADAYVWKIVTQIPPQVLNRYSREVVVRGISWALPLLIFMAFGSWRMAFVSRLQEQATADLADNEKRLAMAIEVSEAAILDYKLSPDQKLFYNSRFSELFGVQSIPLENADDFHKWFLSLIHREDRGRVMSAYEELLAGSGSGFDLEFRMKHVSGEWIWVHSLGDVMQRSAEGNVEHVVGVMTDVTPDRLAKTRLQGLNQLREDLLIRGELEEKLRLITSRTNEIFNADFTRIWISRSGDLCDSGCSHGENGTSSYICIDRSECLHLVASSGRYTNIDGGHRRVPFGCFKIGRIASGMDPGFCTNDVVNDPRIHHRQWASNLGLKSFAGHSLLSNDGHPIGVLAQFSQRIKTDTEDIELEGVANTAAQIVHLAMAEEELKALGGLLPICSKCKKIRDDQGYWNNLEEYIESRSDASFSHSLCDPCMDDLYAGQEWYQKFKTGQRKGEKDTGDCS